MASSADDHRHVSAPPPTPSASHSSSSSATNNLLSHLLLRLPPTLSLSPPTRHRPLLSLSSPSSSLLPAATRLGFFQLTHHSVPPLLAQSAESESLSLFPTNTLSLSPLPWSDAGPAQGLGRPWPVGHHDDHEFFCFDSESFTGSTRSLGELARELERVGLEVLEAVGFNDPARVLPLMWVSKTGRGDESDGSGRVYPYVVALEYQIRCRKVSLFGDSGLVSVSPEVDSILVTFGDIAQVWSNGKIKKVRGRPVPVITEDVPNDSNETTKCISMTMLLTLPLESTVSPYLPQTLNSVESEKNDEIDEDKIVFDSFSFEDYAWRVYHERFHLKDSLDRYRLV